ncbi:MAG: acyltransferase [Gammaproteobacteria bacterium]|nr:acyltransferase [Gammaproteobacteria bacterium]
MLTLMGFAQLRLFLVVGFHAFPDFIQGGFIGVDIFFVISGYLISTIIFKKLEAGSFSFTAFYIRRVLRIFPALLVVLLSFLILGWFTLLGDEYMQLGQHVTAGIGFVSNFRLWSEVGYFDNAAETKPLLHLWSLAIEEQFYIAWPLIVWCAWKARISTFAIICALAVGSFYLNLKGVATYPSATFYLPLSRFGNCFVEAY